MNTTTALMQHQYDAVGKVSPSRIGALFMEMGTGKSRTSIELVAKRQDRIDHAVWFCPVSLKETIRQEILKHTDAVASDICVFDDKTNERNLPDCLWYVIGIESMSLSNRIITTANKLITVKTMIILDESSYIKGHRSKRTYHITEISKRARYRLILTGTPISQGVVDLFSQMRFLSPKILGYESFYSFAANHLEYSEKYKGMIVRSHNTEYIAAKIQPYVYQVTKAECLELPDKLYETRYFSMTEEQWHHYDLAKEEILSLIDDDENVSLAIFRLFSALQSITCGFWNRRIKKGGVLEYQHLKFEHNRIDTLINVVRDIPENEKVIIWGKYQVDVEHIKKALEDDFGEGCVATFYGVLSERERTIQVEDFRNSARFFLATQSCGGHGLTLNEAHHVIFYNNAFKYSERLQAEDRCHRIGQEHKVTYIDIHCCSSIDDRIANALAKKGNAVEEFKREVDKVKGKKARLKDMIKSL